MLLKFGKVFVNKLYIYMKNLFKPTFCCAKFSKGLDAIFCLQVSGTDKDLANVWAKSEQEL